MDLEAFIMGFLMNQEMLDFVRNNIDSDFQNPCNNPFLKKMFKVKAKNVMGNYRKHLFEPYTTKTIALGKNYGRLRSLTGI
jgi:hypothetical protein